jgi:hypothetical protein
VRGSTGADGSVESTDGGNQAGEVASDVTAPAPALASAPPRLKAEAPGQDLEDIFASTGQKTVANKPTLGDTFPPSKPILMCFICKLSFGYTRSFVAHAIGEHAMKLIDREREILGRKNISAIIQGLGKNKEPLMSFLEPNATAALDESQKVSCR